MSIFFEFFIGLFQEKKLSRLGIVLTLFVHSGLCISQNQPEVWYFGQNAGADFSDASPIPLTNGMISTLEGCATICDIAGNILIYTNGETVYTKDHTVMPNGTNLHGHTSSTQAACIVKKPGNNPFFYIFTTDYFINPNGLKYSIVDITLNNGNGEIIEKNIPLLSPVAEKLTTIRHSNGTDIWVITHKWGSAEFYAYLVNESGINNPIVSSAGLIHSGGTYGYYNCIGYMRPSNSGDRIALAIYDMGVFEMFDFNKTNGTVSNPLTFDGFSRSYGVEFSPDDSKLYVKGLYSGQIFQYNLNAGSTNDILNSKTLIGVATSPPSSPNYISGAIQLAPDGKIYISKHNSEYLGKIQHPNSLGVACDFIDNGFYLGGKKAQLGFPHTGISSFLAMNSENYCFGDSTWFFLIGTSLSLIDSVNWNFGDPSTGNDNYSNQTSPFHIFSSPGIFTVTAIVFFNSSSVDISKEVEIFPSPIVYLGNDTMICSGETLVLNAGAGNNSYLWSNGSTDSILTVGDSGIYWVEVTNEYGCIAIDSIIIDYYPYAWEDLSLGSDTTICAGASIALNAGPGYSFYQWNTGSNNACLVTDTAGIYWVYVENPCGSGSDTIIIGQFPQSVISLGQDSTLCFGEFVLLNPGIGFLAYIWQDGSNNQFYPAGQTGIYWVKVVDENGCPASDTIHLEFIQPKPDIGTDTTICSGDSVTFYASDGFLNYLWHTGSDESFLTTGSDGIIWCEVTDTMGCTGIDSLYLQIMFPPAISLGEDATACQGDSLWLIPKPWNNSYVLQWNDGSADSAKLIQNEGYYWVSATNVCGASYDTVHVSFMTLPYVFLGNDTLIALNSELILDAGPGFINYHWSDNSHSQKLLINESGLYWVNVFDGNCYNSDSIKIEPVDCEFSIPIVFTPNMDGYNDYFFAETSKDIADFKLDVFNKWGEIIWTTDNKDGKWDGIRNGSEASSGTYFWLVKYRCYNYPYEFIKKGSVTLLR